MHYSFASLMRTLCSAKEGWASRGCDADTLVSQAEVPGKDT